MEQYFQSLVEQDNCAIVICNLAHEIIYMNPVAIKAQEKRGGKELIGRSLLACHNEDSVGKIQKVVEWFRQSKEHNRVHTFFNEKQNKDGYMIALRDERGDLIGYYEKHEYRTVDETPFYEFCEAGSKSAEWR